MKKPSKKSQLYIITALFLCSLVFLLTARTERLEQSYTGFSSIYSNFISESKHMMNSAIYLNRNISSDLNNFVDDYVIFAASEGINTYIFYALVYEDKIYLGNKLNEPVNITTSTINFILTKDNQSTVSKREWLNADISGISYLFNTSRNITNIKFVFKMEHENTTEVRTYA